MSGIAGQRAEIAAALNTIPGVSASAQRPRVMAAGAAWPIVVELTRTDEVPDMLVTWRVMIVLPSDELGALNWFDQNHEAVDEALQEVAYVTNIGATSMKTDSGDFPVMVVTMSREAVT